MILRAGCLRALIVTLTFMLSPWYDNQAGASEILPFPCAPVLVLFLQVQTMVEIHVLLGQFIPAFDGAVVAWHHSFLAFVGDRNGNNQASKQKLFLIPRPLSQLFRPPLPALQAQAQRQLALSIHGRSLPLLFRSSRLRLCSSCVSPHRSQGNIFQKVP